MYAIAIHGGAGVIPGQDFTPEHGKIYFDGLDNALNAGYLVLQRGGKALDAVEASVACLENNELFNAGKGSVFNSAGEHEMEASIMCGRRIDAGAVCGIRNVKNPIILARKVLEESNHLFLSGNGAERFAREKGLQFELDDYFYSTERFRQLQAAKMRKVKSTGTVGAVALDSGGDLAAATSTGGLTNKSYGRIGDSPIIGAGTYASNSTCAVSCTGDGEYFMRSIAAYDISCLVGYKGLSLEEACNKVIMKKVKNLGGEGGAIAIDTYGNLALVFNSEGMYRGYHVEGKDPVLQIY